MEKEMTYRFADTGHWLARCNHQSRVIELNSSEWGSLSPLMREYVWVHECVHLLCDLRSEAECNRITDEVFVSRARNTVDKAARERFVAAANNQNFNTRPTPEWAMIVLALLSAAVFLTLK